MERIVGAKKTTDPRGLTLALGPVGGFIMIRLIACRSFVPVFASFLAVASAACGASPEAGAPSEGPTTPAPKVDLTSLCFAPGDGADARTIARVTAVAPADGAALPVGFAVSYGAETIEVTDDGRFPDDTAGDGVFSGTTDVSTGPAHQSSCIDLQGAAAAPTHEGLAHPRACYVKTVPCQEGCRSVIFHTRCIVCLEAGCVF